MKTIKQILADKKLGILHIGPADSVYEALRLMAEKNVGSLMVMEGDKLVGIFSERDYARKVILQGKNSRETRISEIMTREVVFVTPERTVAECMAIMNNKKCRHLPVLEGERVIGLLSIGDLVKETISDQRFTIEQLERYIMH